MMQERKTAVNMPTTLRGIANRAKRDRKAHFGGLYRLLNEETLKWCFYQLRKSAATGVDGVSFDEYEANLDENVADLVERLKKNRYRAKLVRRKWIPKAGGKLRPLGIPALEDKLLQVAVARILESIYEGDFLDVSWGYRRERGARTASRVLAGKLASSRCAWVVEADIRGFFDRLDHDWMIRMLEVRVKDAPFLRLIGKWMKAGVLEADGKVVHPVTGTPQGGIISPVLANIYLHYALDLWFARRVKPLCRGHSMLMRYADDFVCAFEHKDEAEGLLSALMTRLAKFGLELAEEKSGLVRFSRFDMERNGGFCFLGFRYHWTLSRNGRPKVQRMTDPKKLQASVAVFTEWIKTNRHMRTHRLMRKLRSKLHGYWNYYGVTGNGPSLAKFWWLVCSLLFKWLNRRSQKRSYNWKGYIACLHDFDIPWPRITESRHPVASHEQASFGFYL
jgi:group II intron reverse transcriptase/maturase